MSIDTERAAAQADEATEHILRIVNDASVNVLLSLGSQTGLLDALAALPPATTQQIADAAGLNERYVREILNGLLTAGIVGRSASGGYSLRREYVPVLTGGGAGNLARMARYATMMGEMARKVADKVVSGGGLSYADYPEFLELHALDSAAVHDAVLVDTVVPLTGEAARLEAGIDVVDIGCGQGHAVNLLARAFPASRFTGVDITPESLEAARAEAAAWGLGNARFVLADAAEFDAVGAYDLVTAFDAIHDMARPADVLAGMRRALRPDGTFLMVDIRADSDPAENVGLPWAAFVYAISTVHCMTVSLGQGGAGLGTAWGVQLAEAMIREAGFATVEVKDVENDPFNVYVVARPA